MEHQLFKITQNAILRNSSGNVLILHHTTGKWLLPGGKIGKGETWFEGLRRELYEEISISDFQITKILDVDSWIEADQGHCVITYLIESPKEFTIKLSDEHKEYVWVQPKDLENYDFWNPKIKERICKAFQ